MIETYKNFTTSQIIDVDQVLAKCADLGNLWPAGLINSE